MSSRSSAPYRLLSCPAEVVVGEALRVQLQLRPGFTVGSMDWIGIYPVALPTLPGLSHGRWRYISACEMAKDGTISVNFNPQSSLPNHEGVFELRVHLNNEYGTPVLRSNPIHFLDAPISKVGRLILMIAFLGIVWFLQHLLNAKGGCDFVDPLTHNDVIWDYFYEVTKPLNRWFIEAPHVGELAQAVSSLMLDVGVLLLVFVSSLRRSSCRSYVALFLFFVLRFGAQIIATIPCPPGFLWPRGKIAGVLIPSVFVDYTVANDLFFSGHTGTVLILFMEFYQLEYHRLAWFYGAVCFPYVATIVVTFRAHRGIDVFAAILAAVTSCSVAKDIGNVIDRGLQIRRRLQHQQHHNQQVKTSQKE